MKKTISIKIKKHTVLVTGKINKRIYSKNAVMKSELPSCLPIYASWEKRFDNIVGYADNFMHTKNTVICDSYIVDNRTIKIMSLLTEAKACKTLSICASINFDTQKIKGQEHATKIDFNHLAIQLKPASKSFSIIKGLRKIFKHSPFRDSDNKGGDKGEKKE